MDPLSKIELNMFHTPIFRTPKSKASKYDGLEKIVTQKKEVMKKVLFKRPLIRIVMGLLLVPGFLGGGYFTYVLFVTTNFHTVVPGVVYRAAQPSPEDMRIWTKTYGLKTVINLRGRWEEEPFYIAEIATAKELEIRHIDIKFPGIGLPSGYSLRRFMAALEDSPKPILLHCRMGADRAGVGSVMAAMALGGESYEKALDQMSIRYLHFDNSPEKIAGVLQQYEAYCRRRSVGTGGWHEFRAWVLNVYHLKYYDVDINVPATVSARPGQMFEIDVKLTNRSSQTIPAGAEGKIFAVSAFIGTAAGEDPLHEFLPRTVLPKRDIAPGESVSIRKTIQAPKQAGLYNLNFDMIEEQVTWFARQGSLLGSCELFVKPLESK